MYKVFTEKGVIIFTDLRETVEIKSDLNRPTAQLQDLSASSYTKLQGYPSDGWLEKSEDPYSSMIHFFEDHKKVEAAGGLVKNNTGQLLAIFRNGCWDLPKGKMETGEKIPETAVREVEEECGIHGVEIVQPLITTYHTYALKDQTRVLKPSHWFLMQYKGDEELIPQTEEGITDVKWVSEETLEELKTKTFPSIKDVIDAYFKLTA